MNEKINFGIIGCGRISGKHVEGIAKNSSDALLKAVCDLIPERMEAAVKRYNDCMGQEMDVKRYSDYQKLLMDPEIQIVNIATESGYHARIAIEALEAGKHVIVEKPMALSIKDADAMIEASKKYNRKLCVSFQNRFNLAVQKLRSAYEAGRFGKLIHGVASIRWNRDENYYRQASWRGTWALDGGALMNQCTHNIDLLQWFLGEAQTVYAQADTFLRPIEGEDCAAIIIRFKNGAIGIVEGSVCVFPRNLEETLSIFGEKGTVCLGGIALNHIEVWKFGDGLDDEQQVMQEYGENPDNVYGFGHAPLFADMIKAVREDRRPAIDGEEGKKALEIILAAYKSVKTGLPVELPLADFSTLDMVGVNKRRGMS
ncbi:putative dehydrogenase [Caldicoprobacter guelmensis]|uniref:Gfo/Idh/MocA family protein n=1 Tax=Caldicoprobacter guelmensis TaxID=1170224 RepID=UPI001959782F|nr:Gfo/Idh/MocA family oxidoreductase [Caldicoprobacter guelmensis]MBM7581713.1 putative dehydrogenase [Caldicoprobacter guelmensis]